MGYDSAVAWILFVIIMAQTLVAFWSSKKWVYYAGDKRS
jgi:oligogalacturonide transport system permease protein